MKNISKIYVMYNFKQTILKKNKWFAFSVLNLEIKCIHSVKIKLHMIDITKS